MTNPITIPDQIVRFTIEGKVTKAELDRIYDDIKATAIEHGKAQLLGEYISFGGFEDFNTAFVEIKRGLASLNDIDRYAILTDKKWMDMLVKAEDILLPQIEMKAFDAVQRATAIKWLQGEDI